MPHMQVNATTQALGMDLDLVRDQLAQAQHMAVAAPATAPPTADVILTLSSAATRLLEASRNV